MQELTVNAKDVTIRLSEDDIDLLLSALNESLGSLEDWEFSTRTGFDRDEFRAIQATLREMRSRMGEEL